MHIITFIWTPYDHNGVPVTIIEHVIFGMMFVCTLGWITALMLFRFLNSFRNIKNNKLIHLYLYDLVNFTKIGEIPEDKFILSSDKNRVVLAEKQYEKESKAFLDNILYYDFDSYCKKHSVSTEEIEL